MPKEAAIARARKDAREGKSPSTQAGEFVREEIRSIRKGEHGARSARQAIAIGLSEARRSGVKLPPPRKGTVSEKTRRNAERAYREGKSHKRTSPKRARASLKALKREGRGAASRSALSRQARTAARRRRLRQAAISRR